MIWLYPGMLVGLAGCAAPILIHLLLRPRPRRQMFPALRLLRAAHAVSRHSRRLRHLLLLAARIVVLALIAAALARPVARGAAVAGAARAPTHAVFCLDDSASMNYRFAGRTYRENAVAWAESLIRDERRFPPGSRYLVLCGGGIEAPRWTPDRAAAARAIRQPPAGMHDRGVAPMLKTAAAALREATDGSKEVYLLTDMTAHAWSGQAVVTRDGEHSSDITYYVLDAGRSEHRNASLHLAGSRGAGATLALPGRPLTFDARITTGDESAEGVVEMWIDGALASRTERLRVEAKSQRDAAAASPPMTPGVHRVELRFDHGDALADDNSVFVAVEAAPRARVAVVAPDSDASESEEVRRVASLLAPSMLPRERVPFDVDVLPFEAPAREPLEAYRLVVWIEPPAPDAMMLARMRGWCESGGTLLIVCGPNMAEQNWSDMNGLGATPTGVETPRPPTAFAPRAEARDAPAGAELTGRVVSRYVTLQPVPQASVTRTFANGAPAIVETTIGSGRVVWWAFSLRTDWSDLGIRAAAVMIELHRLAAAVTPRERRAAHVYCDESARLYVGNAKEARIERVAPAVPVVSPAVAQVDGQGRVAPPTRFAGLYRVAANGDVVATYAVNLRPGETDGLRISDEDALGRFPRGAAMVIRDAADLESVASGASGERELTGDVLALLLGLLIVESLLTGRAGASFSGRRESRGATGAAGPAPSRR